MIPLPWRTRRLRSSPGSQVSRIRTGDGYAVVKRLIGPGADARFTRELAALTAAGPGLAPAVLDADPRRHQLVLEHLEFAPGMPAWPRYAQALARLHRSDPGALPRADGPTAADLDAFLRLCHGLDVTVPAGAVAEFADLLDLLCSAPAGDLLHGDPCLGNVLDCPDGVRFVDFEQAGAGSGAAELAYLRIGFPTCGLTYRLGPSEIAEAEAAYGVPEAVAAVPEHCVGWLIRGDMLVQRRLRGQHDQFARLLERDWRWGPESARDRLAHRCHVVAGFTDQLPAIAAVAGAVRNALRRAPGGGTSTLR